MITVYYAKVDDNIVSDFLSFAIKHKLVDALEKYHSCKNPFSAWQSLVGEVMVREICFRDTSIHFADQQYYSNKYGKPFLENSANWYFNKSHTKNIIVVAVSDKEIGVDVEIIRTARMNVANRYFSAEEIELLESTSSPEFRDQLFYQFWTAKEAYLKFLGIGISYGLSCFTIQKHENGMFSVYDEKGPVCHLDLFNLTGFTQLAVCTASDQPIHIREFHLFESLHDDKSFID